MMSQLTSTANCEAIAIAYGCKDYRGMSYSEQKFERKQQRHFS